MDFDKLREAIKILHGGREIDGIHNPSIPVRINANLVKGTLDYYKDVYTMIRWAAWMGADEIRFSELQNCEKLWVDSREIFPDLPADPFTCGCEQEVNIKRLLGTDLPIKVIVKMTCGRVNRLKAPVEETPIRSGGQTRVLYPDAKVRSGWVTTSSDPDCHSDKFSGGAGCHATGGCH